jgi:uncharacterized protein YdaU (DUF1376 family)
MSLPRMSLHIGDYRKDTGHLRAAGHGAYLLLILHYWATGGLPNDDAQLAAIACMSDREWKKHKPTIKAFFKAGDWKHQRIDDEIIAAREKYEKRASAGKLGGEAKAKAKQTPSNATAKPYQPITLTDKEGVGEGRAREGSISEEAFSINDALLELFKIDKAFVPPGWCGAPMRIQAGLNVGWNREVIVLAAQKIVAKGFTPDGFAYLEKPIAREHAMAEKPIPQGTSRTTGNREGHERACPCCRNRSLVAAARRAADSLRGASGVGDEPSEPVLRLIS